MTWNYAYTPQIWPCLLMVLLLLALAAFSWRRRTVPGARVFAVTCLIGIPWVAGAVMEVAAVDAAGNHQVRMEFAYDGGGLACGGAITLFLDGKAIGEGRVGATMPMIFSLDETMDVGCETGSTVSEDYTAITSKFNGRIAWVQLDQGADDHDHLISPEERWRVAMTRQ